MSFPDTTFIDKTTVIQADWLNAVNDKCLETVSVKDFGAVGDGVTDDTAAIQAALDYCNTWVFGENKPKLIGAPGTYKVTSTLTIACDCDLSAMKIVADGTTVSPVIRVGGTTGSEITWYKQIVLPKVNNSSRTAGQWGVGTGVELTNCNTCNITVPAVREFAVGLSCGGRNQGFAYNNVTLQYIYDNKINVRVGSNSGNTGWANQNVFIGGRLGHTPSSFSGTTNVGSRDIRIGEVNAQANNNTFIGTSIEGATFPEYSIEFYQETAYNQFQNCRYEGTASKQVLFNTDVASGNNSNLIIGGYQAASIVFSYTGAGSSLYNCAINGRGNYIDTTGVALNINTGSGNQPHIQGFPAGVTALGKSSANTNWVYRLYEASLEGKLTADAYPRVQVNYPNSKICFSNGTVAPVIGIAGIASALYVVGEPTSFLPVVTNVTSLGAASYKWTEVFATNGTINTSDEREKQDIATLDEAEKRVAAKLKTLVKKYRFKDAVAKKGDDARIHVGVIAQEVVAAFAAEGLDATRYGLLCYDEWEAVEAVLDEDGNVETPAREAGNAYGIRYDELLAFIIAAL